MRTKLMIVINGKVSYHLLIVEFRKRMYLITFNNEDKISGYQKQIKQHKEGYFLIYEE